MVEEQPGPKIARSPMVMAKATMLILFMFVCFLAESPIRVSLTSG